MSFEYIIEKDNLSVELTKEQEGLLVKNISSSFSSLNSERAKNLEMASSLANEIFFKNDFKSLSDKTKKWKAKVKMCKTFMFYQTLKLLYGEILMQMLILCSTYQEKITTQTTCQTNKKQCLWTSLKKWITKRPATKLLITLYFLVS